MADHLQAAVQGFIVVYRWEVPQSQEAAFRAQWRAATAQLQQRGAFGSCLTVDKNGDFVAIALWPSEEVRAAVFANMPSRATVPGVKRLSETNLQVQEDLWLKSPFRMPSE